MEQSNNLLLDDGHQGSTYKTLFVEVILPLPLPKFYTYRVPNEWNDLVAIGSRVIVQFGKKKIYTAIITGISEEVPAHQAKLLLDILDVEPLLNDTQLKFMYWMSDYYVAHPGEVLSASLPSGLKLSSESNIQLNADYELEKNLSSQEETLLYLLQKKESLSYSEIEKTLGIKNISKLVASLLNRDAIFLFETVKEKYKPKKIKRIRLKDNYNNSEALEKAINSLEKKTKQQEVLLKYLSETEVLAFPERNFLGIPKSLFISTGISESSLKTLIKNHVLEEYEQEVSRFVFDKYTEEKKELNTHQEKAKTAIENVFKEKSTCLFHGITGSGKTEVYIHLIEKYINEGKQVLYLLPEIALSTQIFSRLRKIFGKQLGVYHSRFSDNERVEVYNGLKDGDYRVILGVRSSIFLPFDNLGLVIIDEEHDSSYKQYDPSPRYQARDSALMLAHLHESKVILGTATPSFESYHLADTGKYGLVELFTRHGEAVLPKTLLAPSPFVKDGFNYFSDYFNKMMTEVLKLNQQAIIFQNRRGYSPYMQCKRCGHIPHCVNCNVSLTYHRFTDEMRCHYCSHQQGVPQNCEECGSTEVTLMGMGTEKLEEDFKKTFPHAKVGRLDADTAKSKNKLETIINDFKTKKTNVLIGTQMVTKGLDFEHVTLVAVFDIDRMLFFPDFRASEKVVQLLTQISGRAGRSKKKGVVLIQTNNPEHELIKTVIANDYKTFYKKEIILRKQFLYPPFCRIVKLTVKNVDKQKAERTSLYLGRILKEKFGKKAVIGPEEPVINRIRNQYLEQIIFKLPRNQKVVQGVKIYLVEIIQHVQQKPDFKASRIVLDIDPA